MNPATLIPSLNMWYIRDGELKQTETTVYGRKIPLLEVRAKLLKKHEKLMYLHSDEEIESLKKMSYLIYIRPVNYNFLLDSQRKV